MINVTINIVETEEKQTEPEPEISLVFGGFDLDTPPAKEKKEKKLPNGCGRPGNTKEGCAKSKSRRSFGWAKLPREAQGIGTKSNPNSYAKEYYRKNKDRILAAQKRYKERLKLEGRA